MKKMIEVSAKKVDDAIKNGLETLGLTLDDVDIQVVSAGGFLKKAKVIIYYGEDIPEEPAVPVQPKKAEKAADKPVKEEKAQPQKTEKAAEKSQKAEKVDQKPAKAAQSQKVEKAQTPSNDSGSDASKSGKPFERTNNAAAKTESKQTAAKESAEPQWAAAPRKIEPSMSRDFGKKASKQAGNAQQTAEKQGANDQSGERGKNNDRGRKQQERGKNNGREQSNRRERESVPPTDEQTAAANEFLTKTVELMGIQAKVTYEVNDGLRFLIETEDSRIIGYRGEVLDALQYLAGMFINGESNRYVHVSTDALGYREKRKSSLQGMAVRMAEKALSTGRKVTLEPMNSADRRVIHAALGDDDRLITRSEGHEPMRRIVIIPKQNKQ